MYESFSYIEHFFFSFKLLFLSIQFVCLLICWSIVFSVTFHLVSDFSVSEFRNFSDAVNAGYHE